MNSSPVALVTGGAKRVGRAVVERLAGAGFDVAFTFNNSASEAAALSAELVRRGGRGLTRKADLASRDDLTGLIEWATSVVGRLDVLVNCASVYEPDDHDAGPSPVQQARLLEVNCVAPTALMTHLAGPLKQAGGCVVNFLDLLADRPWPKYSAYCASKAALKSQTLAYARRLAPEVRVNGIAPGVIDWPDAMPQAVRDDYLKRVPLGRAGTPDDAAGLVLWLATAAPYVTGQVIGLDGGRSLVGSGMFPPCDVPPSSSTATTR